METETIETLRQAHTRAQTHTYMHTCTHAHSVCSFLCHLFPLFLWLASLLSAFLSLQSSLSFFGHLFFPILVPNAFLSFFGPTLLHSSLSPATLSPLPIFGLYEYIYMDRIKKKKN